MKIRMEIQGAAPLLMHSVAGADPLNPLVKEIKTITSKRIKTEDDLAQIARLEFEVSMYYLDGIGPFIPGIMIERSLQNGGKITRHGKLIERGVFVLDNENPLIYEGPRTIEGLWEDPQFRSMMAVGVAGRKVMRCRPIFRNWAVDCEIEMDTSILDINQLQQIADQAGAMAGFGDYRPRYGRFTARTLMI